jgi:hypothetical protein
MPWERGTRGKHKDVLIFEERGMQGGMLEYALDPRVNGSTLKRPLTGGRVNHSTHWAGTG